MRRHSGTLRRCIGCMESKEKDELLRIVSVDDGISLDLAGTAPGRGAYLCRNLECLETAVKKNSFSRVFRKKIESDTFAEEFKKHI